MRLPLLGALFVILGLTSVSLAQEPETGWTTDQVIQGLEGRYTIVDSTFIPNYDKRAPKVIKRLRFAPYMFGGYQGVLTVWFDQRKKVESVNWDRGVPKADTAYIPPQFRTIKELLVEGSRVELDQIAKQLKSKFGDPKLSEKPAVVMYDWSGPTRDLYVCLREGKVGYWYKPLAAIK